MIYWQLFLAFLQIGAFSFGGGYAAMPLIQSLTVEKYAWLTLSDFTDLVTIAEMTPGPIAVNAATFVGKQVGGILGAVLATLGVVLPSCIFVTVLAWLYANYQKLALLQGVLKSLRPAVVSMILAAGITILVPTLFVDGVLSFAPGCFQWRAALFFVGALLLLRTKKPNPILVMVGCGILELVVQLGLRAIPSF